MALYYFHLQDGVSYPDEYGTELPNLAAAKREAARTAGSLLMSRPDAFWKTGRWVLLIQNDADETLSVLEFSGRDQTVDAAKLD